MNEMATLFGMALIGGLYFAVYLLNAGRVESFVWRLLSYAGWELALIGVALVIKDWWDLHMLYLGLAKSIGTTGAGDFFTQYHIAFPRANGAGLTGVSVAVVTFTRLVLICGPEVAMAFVLRAFETPLARRMGWFGHRVGDLMLSVVALLATLFRVASEETGDSEPTVTGSYNYRTGKWDDGRDPAGLYHWHLDGDKKG